MAIQVRIQCSDCGTVANKELRADDKEIVCPECRRSMPNLPKEEFNAIASSLRMQSIFGFLAVLLFIAAGVMAYLYVGSPLTWVITDKKEYLDKLAVAHVSRKTDLSIFLYSAIGCAAGSAIFGALSALKRHVVEI